MGEDSAEMLGRSCPVNKHMGRLVNNVNLENKIVSGWKKCHITQISSVNCKTNPKGMFYVSSDVKLSSYIGIKLKPDCIKKMFLISLEFLMASWKNSILKSVEINVLKADKKSTRKPN